MSVLYVNMKVYFLSLSPRVSSISIEDCHAGGWPRYQDLRYRSFCGGCPSRTCLSCKQFERGSDDDNFSTRFTFPEVFPSYTVSFSLFETSIWLDTTFDQIRSKEMDRTRVKSKDFTWPSWPKLNISTTLLSCKGTHFNWPCLVHGH